jgi:hypothetical protein
MTNRSRSARAIFRFYSRCRLPNPYVVTNDLFPVIFTADSG